MKKTAVPCTIHWQGNPHTPWEFSKDNLNDLAVQALGLGISIGNIIRRLQLANCICKKRVSLSHLQLPDLTRWPDMPGTTIDGALFLFCMVSQPWRCCKPVSELDIFLGRQALMQTARYARNYNRWCTFLFPPGHPSLGTLQIGIRVRHLPMTLRLVMPGTFIDFYTHCDGMDYIKVHMNRQKRVKLHPSMYKDIDVN